MQIETLKYYAWRPSIGWTGIKSEIVCESYASSGEEIIVNVECS